MSLLRKV